MYNKIEYTISKTSFISEKFTYLQKPSTKNYPRLKISFSKSLVLAENGTGMIAVLAKFSTLSSNLEFSLIGLPVYELLLS